MKLGLEVGLATLSVLGMASSREGLRKEVPLRRPALDRHSPVLIEMLHLPGTTGSN